jgi:hypothetical protein
VEEAQEPPDIIIGMFSIKDAYAVVLFDSEASHSFVSAAYVGKHNLPLALQRCQIIVSSPGADIPTRQLCLKVNLNIRGVDFVSNLIILESKGIDVILGMGWLGKHKVLIDCVIPRSEKEGTKPPYVCPGCSNHTYSNNMINRFHVQ